jgi:hypothetical protein
MLSFRLSSTGSILLLLILQFNISYQWRWDRKQVFADYRFAQTDDQLKIKSPEASIRCRVVDDDVCRRNQIETNQNLKQHMRQKPEMATFLNHNRYTMASIPTPIQYAIERTILDPQPLQDGWDRVVKISSRASQISTGLVGLVGTWLGVGQSPRSSFKQIGWLKARRVSDVTDDFTVRLIFQSEIFYLCFE